MTKLTLRDLELIENKLRKRQQDLLEEIQSELDERENQQLSAIMGNDPGDDGDLSLADALADLNVIRVDRQINELREVEARLLHINKVNVNECADCGKEIGLQRLLVYPTAVRCISCQERYEHTHVQGNGHPSL
ncbi:MAG: TraR/DksA family transcriptional regulator [Nitrosomonas sp. PRO4]|nr:TraR/DksA family transcriptional regulator [Nitrosomonas sp. PRO4]